MKYKESDQLYYINPFVFFIDLVKIEMCVKEDGYELFYIATPGTYLREEDLFKNLKDAQREALIRLEKHCCEMRYRILNNKPKLDEVE